MTKYALFTQSEEYTVEFSKKISKPEILISRINNIHANTYLNYDSAYSGNYPEVDEDKLKPLNNNILTQMAYAETIVMRMMDRITTRENYYHRQRIYRNHLKYWYSTLDKVDVVIFHVMPHEVFDYIAYACAKIKKIKTYFYYHLPSLPPAFLMYIAEDINNQSQRVSEIYYDNNSQSKYDSKENFISMYDGLLNDTIENRVSYTGIEKNNFKSNNNSIFKAFKKTFQSIFFYIAQIFGEDRSYEIIKTSNIENNKKYFDINNVKYIYFPLHFQPEASSNPIGEFYEDQLIIIQILIDKLKNKNLNLVIKEHPRQLNGSRKKDFYQFFNKNILNNKLIVVDKDTSSHLLLSKSVGVVTISGTIAWEALFAGKPALMFGSRIFDTAPGIIKAKNEEAIENYLNSLEKIEVGILNPKWDFYCKILQQFLINGTNARFYFDTGVVDEKVSARNAVDGLIKYLNKYNSN